QKQLARAEGVQLHAIHYHPRNLLDWRLRRDLRRFVLEGVTVIHFHQPSLIGSITPWFWRDDRAVLIASRHILNSHDKRDIFHRMLYSRLDALVVMSETLKKNVQNTHTLRERQVKTIRLGLDFEIFNPSAVDAAARRRAWG